MSKEKLTKEILSLEKDIMKLKTRREDIKHEYLSQYAVFRKYERITHDGSTVYVKYPYLVIGHEIRTFYALGAVDALGDQIPDSYVANVEEGSLIRENQNSGGKL